MKMSKKALIYSAIFLAVVPSLGNGQTPEDFFPHHLGDMWEYYMVWGIGELDTLRVSVIFDSTGNETSYVSHYRQLLDPSRPALVPWYEHFLVDTFGRVSVWQGFGGGRLVYQLNAGLRQMWIVQDLGSGYDIARVGAIYEDTLFGVVTTVKRIDYFSTEDTSDTSLWLSQYSEELAGGFGTIYRGAGDLGYSLYLRGARVNGVVYGDTTIVSVKGSSSDVLPSQVTLYQNYPNPFNPTTTIEFELPMATIVTVGIYDMLGGQVAVLQQGTLTAGVHRAVWDAGAFPSGVYLCRLQANGNVRTRKMVVLR